MGVLVAVVTVLGYCCNPAKTMVQQYYLGRPKIVTNLSWYDARVAKKIIKVNEPGASCTRIGKELVNGTNNLYVFTLTSMYVFWQDNAGTWQLKSKGAYDY